MSSDSKRQQPEGKQKESEGRVLGTLSDSCPSPLPSLPPMPACFWKAETGLLCVGRLHPGGPRECSGNDGEKLD